MSQNDYQLIVDRIERARLNNDASLYIQKTQLTSLPESIGQLTNLKSLYLQSNKLISLPKSIGQLTNLQTLYLRNNQLKSLPESIGQLTKLQRLSVEDNQLTSLPESIGQLTNLQSLFVDKNKLTSLPGSIGHLIKLESFSLQNNKLTSLPESIGQLTYLESLALQSNNLRSLPKSINELTNLVSLALQDNIIRSLPESIGQLANLQRLLLPNNQLSSLPESIGQLSNLQRLSLDNNRLTSLPESIGQLTNLRNPSFANNQLTSLPEPIGQLTNLESLYIQSNNLTSLPESIGQLTKLQRLNIRSNQLNALPESIGKLTNLQMLNIHSNQLRSLPESIGQIANLQMLDLHSNELMSLPVSIGQLMKLETLHIEKNPLNSELAAATRLGIVSVKEYLRVRAEGTVVLNEAKLILIGEGEVGKTCLMDALRDQLWRENSSTHGINIAAVEVTDPDSGTEIMLNGWDFGGQRVYRPTHQLFFSAPAVYVVVWKPREGSQAGQVKEWIKLVKYREPDAKVLVVATHGGPRDRQPDIDQYEIISQFGDDTVVGFFHVDSKPDESEHRRGIDELRDKIASVAMQLPEMGRKVPKIWQRVRKELEDSPKAWISYDDFIEFCTKREMSGSEVELFAKVSHTLGKMIHYDYDPVLRDIVILKPDWLATAISFVFDDVETRENHGLISFERLGQLWNDAARASEDRYPKELHPAFLRLMERFDLSYEVQLPSVDAPKTILISQLVPNTRPEPLPKWDNEAISGITEQVQICRIVDDSEQFANAEGLFYQLIVRLHKYSLGRENYFESVHWQRGLILDADYNGRALLEHIGNDVKITVRAVLPMQFLAVLTEEVKWLVENFWEGLRCQVTVPCAEPCGKQRPGTALFEVQKLIAFKQQGLENFPCIVSGCDQLQGINRLLQNAVLREQAILSQAERDKFQNVIAKTIRSELKKKDRKDLHRWRHLDSKIQKMISQADVQFDQLMQTLTDEAKEGPRLFSFQVIKPDFFDRPKWMAEKFRLTLWCEHARLPLPELNGDGDRSGVYELELTRAWVKRAAPYLKGLTTTLSLVLPIASSATKLLLDDTTYDRIAKELEFGQKCADSLLKGSEKAESWLVASDSPEWKPRQAWRAEGGMLRELQIMLKQKDPSFGGLVRVQNKQRQFLWVHEQFVGEY